MTGKRPIHLANDKGHFNEEKFMGQKELCINPSKIAESKQGLGLVLISYFMIWILL